MSASTDAGGRGRMPWDPVGAQLPASREQRMDQAWRWPMIAALSLTIPAFYIELLDAPGQARSPIRLLLAVAAYVLASAVVASSLVHAAWHRRGHDKPRATGPLHTPRTRILDVALVIGLMVAAMAPPSFSSAPALTLRLIVAAMILLRLVWALQHLITRGGLIYMLAMAGLILGLCGVGFWWIEPRTQTLGDGLWLAFTTAATVGYGDIVPSTPASKIFSVFVVMLGYGVLSLLTAAIATRWIETEERLIEREILRDMHRQMDALRSDIASLRSESHRDRPLVNDSAPPNP